MANASVVSITSGGVLISFLLEYSFFSTIVVTSPYLHFVGVPVVA